MSPHQVFQFFRQDRYLVVSGVPPGSLFEVILGAKSCSWELKSRNFAAQGSHLAAYAIYAVFAAYCCPPELSVPGQGKVTGRSRGPGALKTASYIATVLDAI